MHAAAFLGIVIILGLIVADWLAFNRKTSTVTRYGAAVSRYCDTLAVRRRLFDAEGLLQLPRGRARLFPEQQSVLLLPDPKRFGIAFRTAWPLNGILHYAKLDEPMAATLTKRMPWSSAVVTGLWFATVAGGTLVYVVSYAAAGGLTSARGAFMAVALSGLGALVCLFGLLIVVVAYRLEDKRLMALYEEFKAAP